MIKHATGLFNETSDELISVLRLDNADSVVGQWDMSELCDFVYRCSLETVFAVVTEQRLGVLRSVPAVGGNISNQTEEDVNTNRQYITLPSQFEKDCFCFSTAYLKFEKRVYFICTTNYLTFEQNGQRHNGVTEDLQLSFPARFLRNAMVSVHRKLHNEDVEPSETQGQNVQGDWQRCRPVSSGIIH